MSIADLFGSVAPQYTMYEADKDQSADYESQIKAYDDAFNQYTQDYDTYKTGAESYNDLVKNYNDKLAAYQTDANAYNTALDIYKKEAQTYNDSLAAYKKQFDDYNAAVNKFNEGDRLTEFVDTDYYVAAPGEFTAKRPDEFTMVRPGEFEVTKPEFTLTEPTAPSDPGFDQAEIDSFIKASQGRARRRGAANAAALNVLGQGGNFSAGAGVQGGAGVSTTPEFSFSATGFEDGGGVGEFFQRFNPLTGSYRKETPLSVKVVEQAQDLVDEESEGAHRLAPALSHRGGELRGAVPGRRVSRHPVRRAAGALGLWVRLVREFSVMIDCRADSDDEVAAQTQKAMRWWALAGRRWRPNDRAHHLPWRRASSSSRRQRGEHRTSDGHE